MAHVSEARRALTRIGSNYARLGISVVLGLLVVRMLLGRLGPEAFGLIGLVGSTIGVAAIFQAVVRQSMVRELGGAYHDSTERFIQAYNAALLLCLGLAGVSAILFALIWLVVPLLRIPPEFVGPARWLVVAKGLETMANIALAPPQRMYVVTERMALFNAWTLGDRASHFLGAVWIITLGAGLAQPAALIVYAWLSALLVIATLAAATVMMMALEPDTVPRPRRATRSAARSILTMGGWNVLTVLASELHLRMDQLLLNLFLGLRFNAVFSVAITLGAYTRMTATGVTSGVDAVAARLSARAPARAMAVLLRHTSRLHALVALPVAALILVLAEPIVTVWLGASLPDARDAAMAATLARLVCLGMTARAISDGWLGILYGAGHVRRYVPFVLAAGLANPVIAIVLLLTLPEPLRYAGPALAYASILIIGHFGLLPGVTARVLGLATADILMPIVRPALVTLAIIPLLLGARAVISDWTIVSLGATCLAAGAVYAGLTWAIVVEPPERRRIRAAILGRLGLAH